MKIIILGALQVGTSVADNLASEANDITLVVINVELLEALAGHEAIMPHQEAVTGSGDHVMVFCTHKKLVRKVEKLFQVSAGFL